MSQGLTWIAGRRTPLVALVALTALAVGMFAAFNPARAATNDVSANSGFCVQERTGSGDEAVDTYTVEDSVSGGDSVTVEVPDNGDIADDGRDDNDDPDLIPIDCSAAFAGHGRRGRLRTARTLQPSRPSLRHSPSAWATRTTWSRPAAAI